MRANRRIVPQIISVIPVALSQDDAQSQHDFILGVICVAHIRHESIITVIVSMMMFIKMIDNYPVLFISVFAD